MRDQPLANILTNQFDYNLLLSCLARYKYPRDKIRHLLKSGEIIRVKKGIYIFGPNYKRPASLPILANLVYGPSYVSKEWALSLYGLIPERVTEITSMTSAKPRTFQTPVGVFSYEHLHPKVFPLGITRVKIDQQQGYLTATPEKALFDHLRKMAFAKTADLADYLFASLRIDPEAFAQKIAVERLLELAEIKPKMIKMLCAIRKAEA